MMGCYEPIVGWRTTGGNHPEVTTRLRHAAPGESAHILLAHPM